jgi:hypothetical protein
VAASGRPTIGDWDVHVTTRCNNVMTPQSLTFINECLNRLEKLHPDSEPLKAMIRATKDGVVDESKLLNELRTMAKPAVLKGQHGVS